MSDATVGLEVEQRDGRVRMFDSGEADLYVTHPRHSRPLSTTQTHATLSVVRDGSEVSIDLDGEALDALVDELYAIQQGEVWDDA